MHFYLTLARARSEAKKKRREQRVEEEEKILSVRS